MITDPSIQTLLDFDPWATNQILDVCSKLPAEEFQKPFPIGPGSLHNILTHIHGAIKTWTDTLAGLPISPRLEADGVIRTPQQLQILAADIYAEFARQAARLPLEQPATRTLKSGKTLSVPRREIFLHVATHGMHHRAQGLNILRQLNIAPLPPSSIMEWRMMQII